VIDPSRRRVRPCARARRAPLPNQGPRRSAPGSHPRPVEGLIEAHSGERGGRPTLRFSRDEEAIERAAASDGITALAANLPDRLSAARVLTTYKRQWMVGRRHRDLSRRWGAPDLPPK
jgi:hypothetical protein